MSVQEIPASVVMKLRNSTGLSMMECKKALVEVGGDMGKAEELLRKKLKGKMDARTDRAAGAGRVTVAIHGPDAGGNVPHAAIIEVRAETDFTAINEHFVAMCARVADLAAEQPVGEVPCSGEMQAEVDKIRITTGENCAFARGHKFNGGPNAVFGAYVHHDGKTGALIHAEGQISKDLLKDIGMHIVASVPAPKGVNAGDIPAEVIEKERKFRIDQAMESGKPKEIAEKMVEGGMRKFFEEIALLEQPYVKDPAKRVKDIIGTATIVSFRRYAVGETA
ncbi:MAG: translation elongation factor Ts [Phycisphaerales bacterium]